MGISVRLTSNRIGWLKKFSGIKLNNISPLASLVKTCGLLSYCTYDGTDILKDKLGKTGTEVNFIKSGDVFSIADKYNEIIASDVNNILYDVSGEPKTLSWSAIANITNQQLIINKDELTVAWYESSLSEPCYAKALKQQKLIEGLFDINLEPLFDIDGSRLYALKDGVTASE